MAKKKPTKPQVKQYEFSLRKGVRGFKPEDAQVIGARLMFLAGDEQVTTQEVVADARDPRSPLHAYFEWDVEKAAEAHWLDRARELVRAIHIEARYEGGGAVVRAFHSVIMEHDGEKRRGYAATDTVLRDRDLGDQVIDAAASEIRGWLRRYKTVKALVEAGVVDHAEAMRRTMADLTERRANEAVGGEK